MPCTESLASRGHRLQDTAVQRQSKIYAPDIIPNIEIETRRHQLEATFIDSCPDSLACGEVVEMVLRIENTGSSPVSEVWLVPGPADEIWVGEREILPGTKQTPHCS